MAATARMPMKGWEWGNSRLLFAVKLHFNSVETRSDTRFYSQGLHDPNLQLGARNAEEAKNPIIQSRGNASLTAP